MREQYPVCELCLFNRQLHPTQAIDHIVPHRGNRELFWDENNWCPVCTRCNRWKAVQEQELGTWDRHPRRIVLCGLPASGKTTLAMQYAGEFGCDYWDADEWIAERGWVAGLLSDTELRAMRAARGRWLRGHCHDDAAVAIVAHPVAAMFAAQAIEGTVHHCLVNEQTRQDRIAGRNKAADAVREI